MPMICESQDIENILFVLVHYRLGRLQDITHARGGMTNDNWFIKTSQGRYFLRRRHPLYTLASIDFELELIEYLVAAGFPTAPLIRTRNGDLRIEAFGRNWELYRYISGERFDVANLAQIRSAARMLAQFHMTAAGYKSNPVPERIINLRRVGRFIDTFEMDMRARTGILGNVLAPPLAGFFRRQAKIVLKRLRSLSCQPLVLIHGDFQPSNMLFEGDKAIALLDFGDAGRSYRAYDIAKAMVRFATLQPGYHDQSNMTSSLDIKRARAFISSYQEMQPLNDREIESIPDLLRGAYLYDAGFFLGKETNPLRQISWIISAWNFSRWIDRCAEDLSELLFGDLF